jgi:hypothetical protein
MTPHLDFPRIAEALALLESCSADAQLLHLKNLCENNGVWTVPQDHNRYSPVLYEVSLFGVPAISDDIERLPDNWMRAARNILRGLPAKDAA